MLESKGSNLAGIAPTLSASNVGSLENGRCYVRYHDGPTNYICAIIYVCT